MKIVHLDNNNDNKVRGFKNDNNLLIDCHPFYIITSYVH